MEDYQRDILKWLEGQEPQLAELYEGAVRMMTDKSIPGRERWICHAVREIRNRLPDAVAGKGEARRLEYASEVEVIANAWNRAGLGSVYRKEAGKADGPGQRVPGEVLVLVDRLVSRHTDIEHRKKENATRLLSALEPENEQLRGSLAPVVRLWNDETEWFVKRAHVGKSIGEEDLVSHFEKFETVLGTFLGHFYKGLGDIEQLVQKANVGGGMPSDDEVNAVVLRLGRAKYRMHFFDRLENPSWIGPLKNAGFFECPAEPEVGEAYERWPQGRYLEKVAGGAALEVLAVIAQIRTSNPLVRSACLECLLEMPVEIAAKGVGVVENLLPRGKIQGDWGWVSGGQEAATLMVALAEEGHLEGAFKIAWVLLDAWVARETGPFEEIVAKFSEHDYLELVLKGYAKVWEIEPGRAFWVLVKILNRCLEVLDRRKGYDVSSNYYAGLGLRDLDSIEVEYGGIETVLVKGMCEAGQKLVTKRPDKVGELMDGLEELGRAIFVRVEMYLLRFVTEGTETARIERLLSDARFLEQAGYEFEYKALLRDKFDEAGGGREVFEKRVDGQEISDVEEWEDWFRKTHGKAPTQEDKSKYVASMKGRALYLVKERYPEQYEKYEKESGLSEADLAPPPMLGEVRCVSPTEGSPLTVEEMGKLTVSEVLEYVNDRSRWEIPERRRSPWQGPEEGLVGVFKADVKKRAREYLKEGGDKLASVPAEFLSAFFYSVEEMVREGSFSKEGWGGLLDFGLMVVEQKRRDEAYRYCFSALLSTLRDGFSERENKVEFDKGMVRKFWGIIEPLIDFPVGDMSRFGEERDPVQLFCSIVAGQALELTVLLGIVCKREFEDLHEGYVKEERQKCYEYVLREVRQPGVNCVFGLNFSRIYWLDKEWVEATIESIFCDELWDETWGAYVSWGRPSPDGLNLMAEKGMYQRAVELLGQENRFKFRKDPEEGLVEHLMIAYFNGWVEFQHPVLREFFERAPAELRGKAVSFLRTGFKPVKEGEEVQEAERAEKAGRIKVYWERRLDAIEQDPAANLEETVEFGDWVMDSLLEAGETFGLLDRTLDLSGGRVGERRDEVNFVKGVCELAAGHELEALGCLNKAGESGQAWTSLALYETELKGLLGRIVELPKGCERVSEIVGEGMRLADGCGRRGYDFKELYNQLAAKAKSLG